MSMEHPETVVAEEQTHPGRLWIKYARVGLAVFLLGIGVFLITQAPGLGYEDRGAPGPGYFPFWVGVLLVVLSAAWGIVELRAPLHSQAEQDLDPRGVWRALRIIVALIVLAAIFQPVGYNLSVLAFMLFLTFTMGQGKGKAWVNVVVSLAASFGVYLAFEKLLGVTLPDSIVPFLAAVGL